MTPSPSPRPATPDFRLVTMTDPSDAAADALWERLTAGQSARWLEEVRELRGPGDTLETSLDVWSVGLIAALKKAARREVASIVLTRLSQMPEDGVE